MRRFRVLGLIAFAAAPVARAASSYDSFVLPLTEAGDTVELSEPYNPQTVAAGQAVGYGQFTSFNTTFQHALFWSWATGSGIDLNPASFADSVANGAGGTNQVGAASGPSTANASHAMIWSGAANSYIDLNPTDLPGITNSAAIGIGGSQQIGIGGNSSSGTSGNYHPILWTGTAASAVDLTPTNLGTTFVGLRGVAADGTNQVGAGNTESGQEPYNGWHALLWSGSANSAVDLTPTDYPSLVNSYAYGVAGDQEVGIAYATVPNDPFAIFYNAMLWTSTGASAVDLGVPAGMIYTKALGTNGSQQVGMGYGNTSHALIWSGTAASVLDLNNFLPAAGKWNSSIASSIDPSGDAYGIATGTLNGINASFGVEWVPISSTGPIAVASGELYQFAANSGSSLLERTISGLTINASGSAVIAIGSSRQLLQVNGLTIAGSTGSWTGKLDIGNSDLDLAGASLATVTSQIRQGFNNGQWNGSGGITSASAAADSTHLTALGVIQNNQGGAPLFTASHLFDSVTPGAADVLVKYTYYGDANLDGTVDASDYSRIDNGYLNHLTGWYNGDFNYDGVVNGSDYTLIDNAYNRQGASIASVIAVSTEQITDSSVPEPGALGLVALGWSGLLTRRYRRQ